MGPKSKSKIAAWYRCDVCRTILSQKDTQLHQEGMCPPQPFSWTHGFILKKVLHSWISEKPNSDSSENIPPEELPHMVWLSPQVIQLCGFKIGDPVFINDGVKSFVKTVWPTREKSVTSVLMTKDGLEMSWDAFEVPVKISHFKYTSPPAQEVIIDCNENDFLQTKNVMDILLLVHNIFKGRYINRDNVLCVPYYGKNLKFNIISIVPFQEDDQCQKLDQTDTVDELTFNLGNVSLQGDDENRFNSTTSTPLRQRNDLPFHLRRDFSLNDTVCSVDKSCSGVQTPSASEMSFNASNFDNSPDECRTPLKYGVETTYYHVVHSTKWKLNSSSASEVDVVSKRNLISSVGGLESTIVELEEIIGLALQSKNTGSKLPRGVLLFGQPGTGKTLLAKALAEKHCNNIFTLQGPELFSKFLGETESKLKAFFAKALSQSPAVILLDEIDSLCPKRSNHNVTELERRVVSTLCTLLDDLSSRSPLSVVVLATTSKPDRIDSALRRSGRLDREVEIPVPSPQARQDILQKLLEDVPHTLTVDQIKSVSQVTHGFVGADLASLVSRAGTYATQEGNISMKHIDSALTRVSPSAMREVLVDVPNVHWSDVAGQADLKLKLQQSVQWPLTHPEAFERLGIKPPRGVLMFGPPGCSKTMIAKALATESKLNFLSIKGPELFSKWVGESEKAVRELFRRARQVAPAIVFFDELDALGGERGNNSSGSSNVQERVLAQLLTEMDGISSLGAVTVVAATNRPDRIDKALLRPGRLDRIVYVPLPDDDTRKQLFHLQLSKMPIDADVKIEDLVENTKGYSGAEVIAVCHEAALKALEETLSAEIVSSRHFLQALSIVSPRTPPSLLNLYADYLKQ